MRTIRKTSEFKSDYKREMKGPHANTLDGDLRDVLSYLVADKPLPARYQDHPLQGNYRYVRDLHLHPDLLLLYTRPKDKARGNKDLGELVLVRLGSHSELFG